MRTRLLSLLLLFATTGVASAVTLSYTGSLDPNNADDVFETSFTLTSTGLVNIQTYGYGGSSEAHNGTNAAGTVIAAGGFDPYVSLFLGSGDSATFLASNDDGNCPAGHPDPACEDSTLHLSGLAAGIYTLALTTPGNFSIAENYGYGTLGDGFIGLQGDYFDDASNEERTSDYAVDISYSYGEDGSGGTAVTPEPNSLTLLFTGLLAPAFLLLWKRKHSFNTLATS